MQRTKKFTIVKDNFLIYVGHFGRLEEPENFKTVPVLAFFLITVPVPVPGHKKQSNSN
jgi:hypothetical protein